MNNFSLTTCYWATRKTIARMYVLFIKHVMRKNPGINLST